jgi:hypothetical protein
MEIKSLRQLSVITLVALLLIPIIFAAAPASAQSTYNVMIRSPLRNGVTPTTSVPITMDGQPTNHSTPWDFMGLTGVHNFTVPYEDSSGHPFRCWTNTFLGINVLFTTITLSAENASSSGFYYAQYDSFFNQTSMTWPETRCFITPNDPAVIAAAGNMTWDEIVDWVAINISPAGSLDHYQFPNETLAVRSGVCREYSGLAVSMLEARGYTAYIVAGNTTGHLDINHAWIALELNGTLYHYEPQRTWERQPEPLLWAQNRTAWFFYNDKVFIPATATQDLPPPPADTYTVTIVATSKMDYITYNDYDAHAQIFLDGKDTGQVTPYIFGRLKGNHTFSVAYQDTSGKPFYEWWDSKVPENRYFPSVVITEGGTYCARYIPMDYTHPSPSQMHYFITPNDSAVVNAASGKNWSQIVNYVNSLPIVLDNSKILFPNETLSGSYHSQDFALLCCSMLLANGYTAYLAANTAYWGIAWVVLDVNGTLTAINPYEALTKDLQHGIRANYYANQSGIYPAILTECPQIPTPTSTPSSTYQSSPSSDPTPITQASTKPQITPNPSSEANTEPTPSTTIPEYPTITVMSILSLTGVTIVFMKKAVKKHGQTILP